VEEPPALTGLLSDPLGGTGRALSVIGIAYALAAAVVLVLLPETRGLAVDTPLEPSA